MDIKDKTLFKLIDIEEIEIVPELNNMVDIGVEGDNSFCLANGIISHNSAVGNLISTRNQDLHGGLPLRGKVKNTWGESAAEIVKNREIFEIMTCVGLKFNEDCFEYKKPSNEWFTIETENGTMVVNGNDEIYIDGKWIQASKLYQSEEKQQNEQQLSAFFL